MPKNKKIHSAKSLNLLIAAVFMITTLMGQPPINERYSIDDETYTLFSSVISTDSCYYVVGAQGSELGIHNSKSFFGRFNLTGEFDYYNVIENDTLGIAFYHLSEMIQTAAGNFVQLAVTDRYDTPKHMLFVKMNYLGDTLVTHFLEDFINEDSVGLSGPSTIVENPDGTFYALAVIYDMTSGIGGLVFFKLSENGALIRKEYYFADILEDYTQFSDPSMIKINENRFVVGGSIRKVYEEPINKRFHTRIMVVDSIGDILQDHIYYDDLFSIDCYGLVQTNDNGYLFGRRLGNYIPEVDVIRFTGRIVKLNADFEIEWQIPLGEPTIAMYLGLQKIIPINASEFVAVGHYTTSEDLQTGILVKFNLDGEVIWERRYKRIPSIGGELALHLLYDVDITSDGGFVMVGHCINPGDPEELPGQKGWLVKTDSEGCLVPGCEDYQVGIAEEDDLLISPIYPNPASQSIFYYHIQANFEPVDIIITSISGQVMQKWSITSNDITYELDVSCYSRGSYFLTVVSENGQILDRQCFIKQ